MRHSQPKQYLAATHRAVVNADSIEWEELPSLAGSLGQRLVNHERAHRANDSAFMVTASGSPWAPTLPSPFDPAPVSNPFREPLRGLATREVVEPDVFRHFFESPPAE